MKTQFQEMLADVLDAQARWRDLKAEEYPEDARNERSALALTGAAAELRAIQPGDSASSYLAELAPLVFIDDDFASVLLGENAARVVNSYGFHAWPDLTELLRQLVSAAREDEAELAREDEVELEDEAELEQS